MPFLIEILAGIMAMTAVIATIASVGVSAWDNYQKHQAEVRLERLKSKLEEFYRDNAMAINSALVPDNQITTRNGQQPSGQILLPNGQVLGSYLGGKPVSVKDTSMGAILYFVREKDLWDEKNVPFRIYITPLQQDPEGRFAYRDIYIISGKGRIAPVASYPTCQYDTNGYYKCTFTCAPDEKCVKVDGYQITLDLWEKTYNQLANDAKEIQLYAQQLYVQDPQKDVLKYYLSHESTNNKNDENCNAGEADCYFSHLSEIRNSTLYNTVTDYSESFNGYTVYWTPPTGSRLAYLSSVPFLSPDDTTTPFHSRIYYDNSSNLIRNPQTVSNYAGYTMLLYTPIDDNHGIEYVFGQ